MRNLVALAAVLGLISCRDGGGQIAAVDRQPAPDTGAALQVAQLDVDQRNGVFEKAIRAAGAACPKVTQSERAEVRPGVKGWKAQCTNDTAHLIEIMSDGTAKVTSRTY